MCLSDHILFIFVVYTKRVLFKKTVYIKSYKEEGKAKIILWFPTFAYFLVTCNMRVQLD